MLSLAKTQQFTSGVVCERGFCGKFAENSRKFAENTFDCVRKFCGNFAEICRKLSAMTPSRTTSQVNCWKTSSKDALSLTMGRALRVKVPAYRGVLGPFGPSVSSGVSKKCLGLLNRGVFSGVSPRVSPGGRAKPGQFGSLALARKNRHLGGESSRILAGKARKCGRFWVFACVPNPGKRVSSKCWKKSTKKMPNRPRFLPTCRVSHGVWGSSRGPLWDLFFGLAQTVFLVNRVIVPCQKGAILTKTAKMMNSHSTHWKVVKNKSFAPQTPEND